MVPGSTSKSSYCFIVNIVDLSHLLRRQGRPPDRQVRCIFVVGRTIAKESTVVKVLPVLSFFLHFIEISLIIRQKAFFCAIISMI